MKQAARFKKAYSQLTVKERFELSLLAIARGDWQEADRLRGYLSRTDETSFQGYIEFCRGAVDIVRGELAFRAGFLIGFARPGVLNEAEARYVMDGKITNFAIVAGLWEGFTEFVKGRLNLEPEVLFVIVPAISSDTTKTFIDVAKASKVPPDQRIKGAVLETLEALWARFVP